MRVQVAFLTGQSDPRTCDLSARQTAFLDALPIASEAKVRRNFPYRDDLGPHRPIDLVRASASNVVQVAASYLPVFRAKHRARVLALIARAERTLFLAGSCGIELYDNLRLPRDCDERVTIVAYGPVARRAPRPAHVTIGSTRDPLSRACFPHPNVVVDVSHLDYLESPIVFATCCERIAALDVAIRDA